MLKNKRGFFVDESTQMITYSNIMNISGHIFWRKNIIYIMMIFFFTGCATSTNLERVSQGLQARNTLAISASQPITLSAGDFKSVVGIFDSQSKIHLAGFDTKGNIHHIVIAEEILHDEIIGQVTPNSIAAENSALDIIEYPKGIIRIAADNTEHTQPLSGGNWVIKNGNRCRRYLVGNHSLFCAFVATGDEVNSAARTDVDFYLIYLVPFFWQTQVRPGKFVLAQKFDSSWVIRTIVDPTTEWSADESSFYIDLDNTNQIHLFFNCRKGGKIAMLGPTGGLGGGPSIVRRYARFQLPTALSIGQDQMDWQAIQSENTKSSWLIKADLKTVILNYSIIDDSITLPRNGLEARTLSRNLALEADTGDVLVLSNLIDAYWGRILGWGTHRLSDNQFDSIAVHGFPGGINFDVGDDGALLEVADDKSQHALIQMCESGWWTAPPCKMVYLQRSTNGRVGSVVVDSNSDRRSNARTLIVGNGNTVFAAWPSAGGRLMGRWLRRSEGLPDQ